MLSGIHFKEKVQSVPEGKFIRIRRKAEDENALWELLTNLNIQIFDANDIGIINGKGVILATINTDYLFSKGVLFTSEGDPVYDLTQQYLPKEDLVKLIKDLPLGSVFNVYYQDKEIIVNKLIPLFKKMNIFFHYDNYNDPEDKTGIHCRLISERYFSMEGLSFHQNDHVVSLNVIDQVKHFSLR